MQQRNTTFFALVIGTLALLAAPATLQAADAGATRKAFTPDDLVRLYRLSDPEVSPDGRYVAYTLRETDIDANRGRTDIWLLDLNDATKTARRVTQHAANDSTPRWAADGRGFFFLSTRSGSSQIWYIALAGGEAQQVTDLPLDVGSFKVSPQGDRLALTLEVFPDCADLKCSVERIAARAKEKASGKTYDQLFVRHWDTWVDGTISTLFSVALKQTDARGLRAETPVNVSGKIVGHVPSKPSGGDEDYTFSPDGSRLVWSARLADRSEPWSTNFDLYEAAADGSGTPRNLTEANKAWDAQPVFLANGDLAWLAMSRPGFEADRFALRVREAASGKVRAL
ncbi:MAG: S9 family peptidase, partial [Gammaproteobacteria bacterium]|nr:S9 family peptidase [Gammaproteobacteria bacterium]